MFYENYYWGMSFIWACSFGYLRYLMTFPFRERGKIQRLTSCRSASHQGKYHQMNMPKAKRHSNMTC